MKNSLLAVALSLAPTALVGCADLGPEPAEDDADDAFLADGKADAFGVEDWSPDGAAVLKLVSQRTKAQLRDDVGLSSRVAGNIVTARTARGGAFDDLAQLDAVPYVGARVFKRLLTYANATKMFRTSLRVPLVFLDAQGDPHSITEWNDEARAAGLTPFARYTFIDTRTVYGDKMERYQERLDAVFATTDEPEVPQALMYAYGPEDFDPIDPICYVGRGGEVATAVGSRHDDMFGDMFSIWSSRFEDEIWVYEDFDEEQAQYHRDALEAYDLDDGDVAMMWTNCDDCEADAPTVLSPCR